MANNHLIGEIATMVFNIIRGDDDAMRQLTQWGGDASLPKDIAHLCEQIAQLALQSEARSLHLELIIEDLLSAQAEVQEAHLDPLTGLPNRTIFHEKLQAALDSNGESESVALCFIDLDCFKDVNDSLGHDAGDELLQFAVKRMQRRLRESDVLARIGGDEFTVILSGIKATQDAMRVAASLTERLNSPFKLNAGEVQISSSIGVSFYPAEADTPLQLLKNADIAMYFAKESGKNCTAMFRDSLGISE